MTFYNSLTELCDFSFLSLVFKVDKMFCFPSLKKERLFSMWNALCTTFVRVPLLKKHTHSQTVGESGLHQVDLCFLTPAPRPPASALRFLGLQRCQTISPETLFTAAELGLRVLSSAWDWTQHPVLSPWSLCLGHALDPYHTRTTDLRSLGRSPSVHSVSCPAWFVPRGMIFFSSLKIDVLFFPTSRISGWFRNVEIIKSLYACQSGPRVPYLPDVSMFPRGSRGWVIPQVGKDQEKEPQSTQKGEDGIDRPERGAGVQPSIKSAFQRKEQILHHLNHTAALRQLSQGVHLGIIY